MTAFRWRSESDEAAPAALAVVDDALTADEAMKRVSRGEGLEYRGDFRNAKQLLSAMGRRLEKRRSPKPPKSALDAFRSERRMRQAEAETLSRVVVRLDAAYRLALAHAPDVAEACALGVGPGGGRRRRWCRSRRCSACSGAAEWRRKGLAVPGLSGHARAALRRLHADARRVRGAGGGAAGGEGPARLRRGHRQRGARPSCCSSTARRGWWRRTWTRGRWPARRENAARLGLADRFEAVEVDGFPEGRADLVVCNPPWIPEPPKTRLDRAVFDEGGRFLVRFLEGLAAHLSPGGQGALVLSDLAVHLGLRAPGWLDAELERVGLRVAWKKDAKATHGKAKDAADPLHAARAKEVTTLYGLVPK